MDDHVNQPRLWSRLQSPLLIPVLVQVVLGLLAFRHSVMGLIGGDAAFFAYVGRATTEYGAVPYLHIWDTKPPVTHLVAIGITSIVPGGPNLAFITFVVFMIAVWIALGWLVIEISIEITGSTPSAYGAALTYSLWVPLAAFPFIGFRPKLPVLLLGLLGVLLALRSQPMLSGASATAAAGMWQFGIIFPVLVVLVIHSKYTRRDVVWTIIGAALVTVIAVTPFILAGATTSMVAQTIIVPFIASEQRTLFERILFIGHNYEWFGIVAAVGGLGMLLTATSLEHRWLSIAGIWFGAVWLVDLDGAADLIPFTVLAAIGMAVAISRADIRYHWPAVAGIAVLSAPHLVLAGTDGALHLLPHPRSDQIIHLYLSDAYQHRCHVRLSGAEQEWMAKSGADIESRICGPYDSYLGHFM